LALYICKLDPDRGKFEASMPFLRKELEFKDDLRARDFTDMAKLAMEDTDEVALYDCG
jgi:hypothetical protein